MRLPPLNSLRAFEAAARHLNLGNAADELYVTTGAISQQIKHLEDHLGIKLFHRVGRGLVLTEEAERALPALQKGFASLREATKILKTVELAESISLAAAPSFASKWLMPRLSHFSARNPEVDIKINATELMIERGNQGRRVSEQIQHLNADIAFVFGEGQYADFHSDSLFDVHMVVLCSPALVTGTPPLATANDLRLHTLLHDDSDYDNHPAWHRWLDEAEIEGVNTSRGMRFSHVQLAIEAAIEQQGVLLSLDILAARDIAAGRLCSPFGPKIKMDRRYIMVCRKDRLQNPAVAAFREWVLSQTD